MVRDLSPAAARSALLPGGASGLYLVLFWRASGPNGAEARRRFSQIDWPDCLRPVAVDLDQAPEIADWFCPTSIPMLAVVTDGAMLDMAYDCTVEAGRRLADSGQAHYLMMASMSA